VVVLTVLGTRPEAIKLAPVIRRLGATAGVRSPVCVTFQHDGLPADVLLAFGIRPDVAIGAPPPDGALTARIGAMVARLGAVIAAVRPDWVLVQGDTGTALAGALAGFYARVKVAHIEAGLRSFDLAAPWPEEMHRRLIAELADLHFAPTEQARRNLLGEGVADARIAVTGNTGIDALHEAVARLDRARGAAPPQVANRRTVLVTQHRRESFGAGIARVAEGVRRIADRGDVEVLFPLHPNPAARAPAQAALGAHPAVRLLGPQDYLAFVALMRRAALILTDSGGVQEEAPVLGKPLLVTRETTERMEGVEAGTALLVGTDPGRIEAAAARVLDDEGAYRAMSRTHSPYGDGRAAERIVRRLLA